MKKLLVSLALLTAVAALHADEQTNKLTKQSRAYLRHSPDRVSELPISPRAKAAEHQHMVSKGQQLHDAMASDDASHEGRMAAVKEHTKKHASSLPGRQKSMIITQD